ncbi:MAG: antibiotic biosynthesis monooxygenase family protein [Chloroflexota bacterium]
MPPKPPSTPAAEPNAVAATPRPPYYAVIFTSVRTDGDDGYSDMAAEMVELASRQAGFLGMESARDGLGITVSYWASLEDIQAWRQNAEHRFARQMGRQKWYRAFKVRVCKVEREYGFERPAETGAESAPPDGG